MQTLPDPGLQFCCFVFYRTLSFQFHCFIAYFRDSKRHRHSLQKQRNLGLLIQKSLESMSRKNKTRHLIMLQKKLFVSEAMIFMRITSSYTKRDHSGINIHVSMVRRLYMEADQKLCDLGRTSQQLNEEKQLTCAWRMFGVNIISLRHITFP